MKILAKNPVSFTHPQKQAIELYLSSHAQNKDVPFDDVRIHFDVSKEQIPDGVIHQIALDAGYKVE
jgi:hypothetical protein